MVVLEVEQRKKTDLDSEKVELALFLDSWCGNGKLGQGSSIRKQVWRNLYELAWPTTDDCKASSVLMREKNTSGTAGCSVADGQVRQLLYCKMQNVTY